MTDVRYVPALTLEETSRRDAAVFRFWSLADSPSAHDEPERPQVAVVSGPQGRRHPILVRRVQLLPCGLLQRVQEAVPGRPVVPVVHGGAPGSLRVRFHGGSGGSAPLFRRLLVRDAERDGRTWRDRSG